MQPVFPRVRQSTQRQAGSSHAARHVLVWGGIGITLLAAMARHLARVRASVELHYSALDAGSAPFLAELTAHLCAWVRAWLPLTPGRRRFHAQPCRQAGLIVASACEIVVCGACERPVVSGVVLHRDGVLPDAGCARSMMTCVSRGRDQVVLDL
jgi:hypothetical protein